ncbi:MAG: S49 family peptidase [Parachlamydiaceae bacterium]
MRDSILYSATRALAIAFCVVIGLCLGFVFITVLINSISGNANNGKLTTVNTEEILPNAEGKREALANDSPVILQINVDGVIGLENLNNQSIRQQLIESREGNFKDDRVKALFLYINTPGGTVTDADGIFRAIQTYKETYKVPVYAYVDGLCASGGMYVALAADKIFASDTSLIGSVGVIAPTFLNVTKLLDKVGVEALTISAGKDKDALNPLRPWKPDEDANYRQIIDFYYTHFVELVALHRPAMDKELLIKDYGAKIFPAPLAKEYGYIDVSGSTLADALKELVKNANIADDAYQVVRLENRTWWTGIFSSQASSLFNGTIKHHLSISPEIDLMFRHQFLYLYTP